MVLGAGCTGVVPGVGVVMGCCPGAGVTGADVLGNAGAGATGVAAFLLPELSQAARTKARRAAPKSLFMNVLFDERIRQSTLIG